MSSTNSEVLALGDYSPGSEIRLNGGVIQDNKPINDQQKVDQIHLNESPPTDGLIHIE